MSRNLDRELKIGGKEYLVGASGTRVRVFSRDNSGKILHASGATVPTDADSGYAKGSTFIQTDGGVGTTLYVNEGSATSCDFNAIAPGGVSTFVGLSDTPANYTSAAYKIARVNAGATAIEFVTADATIIRSLTEGNIIVGDASNIGSALDASGDGQILVGNGTTITSVAVSGDATLANDGTLSVSDLTIASEAQGDVLYFNGTNWVPLGAGTSGQALVTSGVGGNPYWGTPSVGSASSLANNVTCEAGANDYTLDFGTAGGAYTLTVPAVGGSRTFAFINEAQTFSAVQTFAQSGVKLQGGDTNCLIPKANETLSADRTLNIVVNDSDRTIDLTGNLTLAGNFTTAGAWTHTGAHTLGVTTTGNTTITLPTTGTLATLAGAETLTNKTLTSAVLNTGISGTAVLDEDNMASNSATQVATQQSIKAYVDSGTVTFTNKSINCDGTGNSLTNVNADELDAVAAPTIGDVSDTVYAVPTIIYANISNQAAAVNIYSSDAPFKFRILRAWSINKSVDGGTWKLNNGAGGTGTDITNAVTVAANDQDIDEPTDYDDSVQSIASGGSLSIVPDGGGALDADIYIEIIRVD